MFAYGRDSSEAGSELMSQRKSLPANENVHDNVGEVVDPVNEGDKFLVTINDRKSIVSVDEDELIERQVQGDDIMILSLMKQTERLSVSATPKKAKSSQPVIDDKYEEDKEEANPSRPAQKIPSSDLPDNVHRDADVYAQFGSISGRNALMSISPYKHRESRMGTANKSKVDASDQKALL